MDTAVAAEQLRTKVIQVVFNLDKRIGSLRGSFNFLGKVLPSTTMTNRFKTVLLKFVGSKYHYCILLQLIDIRIASVG